MTFPSNERTRDSRWQALLDTLASHHRTMTVVTPRWCGWDCTCGSHFGQSVTPERAVEDARGHAHLVHGRTR